MLHVVYGKTGDSDPAHFTLRSEASWSSKCQSGKFINDSSANNSEIKKHCSHNCAIEQKGITWNHDFCYSFSFSCLREEKRGKEKPKSWFEVMPFCSIQLCNWKIYYILKFDGSTSLFEAEVCIIATSTYALVYISRFIY